VIKYNTLHFLNLTSGIFNRYTIRQEN